MSLSPLLFDQVDIQLSGQSGETGTNGVIMNAIPKAGGNRFSGSALVNGSGPSLQGSNVTDDLKARGVPGRVVDAEDALRHQRRGRRSDQARQGVVLRHVALLHQRVLPRVDVLRGGPDGDRPRRTTRRSRPTAAPTPTTTTAASRGRSTTSRSSPSWYAYQYKVDPHWLIQIFNASPEAVRITTWHTQLSTTKWTYTATNKLLFEAGLMAGESPDTIMLDPDQVGTCPSQGSLAPRCISIIEQTRRQLLLSRADRLRLRRSAAQPVVQRVDELRDRLAQREGRVRDAARPLLAR